MIKNNSPWITELDHSRTIKKLIHDHKTDIAIIGGGIAGMVTAYFTLKHTDKTVILLEGHRIAHGATGHNAGQVVDYFERPFSELVEEYGLELAGDAQKSILSAWDLLQTILIDTSMDIEFSKFTGYAGCASLQHLMIHLENKYLKQQAGITIHKVLISEDFQDTANIPAKYYGLFDIVPHTSVQELLETHNTHYIAALQSQKGCVNSALFVEKLAVYLSEQYKSRFTLLEETLVDEIELHKDYGVIHSNNHEMYSQKIVLCTNGFEKVKIINKSGTGTNIDRAFHSKIYGIVGYMAGYIEERKKDPIAISYFPHQKDIGSDEPYFYLTRRNFEHKDHGKSSLICIGGPEKVHEEEFNYYRNRKYPQKAKGLIDNFLKYSYKHRPAELTEFAYTWHGLMGYTPNMVRCIGPEPLNPVLMYNIGCNGIGILPSIYGGKKISDHIAQKPLKKTIFDPVSNDRK